ncbi:MAG: helix-turn-helix domain-containing protein [Albidovulum sp.]
MQIMIVLVPGFSHLTLGAIIEPLQTLRRIAPECGVEFELGAIDGPEVASSADVRVHCPLSFADCIKELRGPRRPDALFLCLGLRTPYHAQRDIQKLLRVAHRAGVPLFGTGCAAWKMADAGILQRGSGTVHWQTLAAFAERHHDVAALDALFTTSGHVTSTPGEAAALDMVIAFVEDWFGAGLAQQVCRQLMIGFPRRADTVQPRDRSAQWRDAPQSLRQMVALMGENLESPLRVRDIASAAGLSVRQAERQFRRYLGMAPKRHYLRQRLEHGRLLIEQTSMSILEISIAVGFSTRRVFTLCYRREFGFPPAHTRRNP